MTESEKLLKWLEISAYPEQAEIVEKMIEREKKLLEFVKEVTGLDKLGAIPKDCPLEQLSYLEDRAEELLKEIGEIE